MTFVSPIEHWNQLAIAADGGQLFLDSDAARHSDNACTDYIATLDALKVQAVGLSRVQGMGDFPSGILLAKKFSDKAMGGNNNLVDVLQSHIDVVMAMQAVFRKFFDATEALDQDNAAQVGQNGPK